MSITGVVTRLESPLGLHRRTVVGSIAGLGAALVLVGGSLSGLSDDILHFSGWSKPSVSDRGGSVGLAELQRSVPQARTGPAPAGTASEIVAVARALRGEQTGDRAQAVRVRRPGSRPGTRAPGRRGGEPLPAGPEAVAQTPPAAPAPAPAAQAPVAAPAQPVQVAVVPQAPTRETTRPAPSTPTETPTRTAERTREVGNSGKVKAAKPVKKKDAEPTGTTGVQTNAGSTGTKAPARPEAPAAPKAPGRGPDGQGAPGHRKASSPDSANRDRDHHGVGNVRGPGSKKH